MSRNFLNENIKSKLNKWVYKNNFKAEDAESSTHLLLNGGKWAIPSDKINIFRKYYSQDIQNGVTHFICEKKTPTYKLFIDVDLLDDHLLTDSVIMDYCKYIYQVILHYYSNNYNPSFIICTTSPKTINRNNINYIKTGIHIICPEIIVSWEQMNILRNAIIQYLNLKVPRPDSDPWDKVIDETVYTQNGLRMIYSSKVEFCKLCKNQDTCHICNKNIRYNGGRPYEPYKIIYSNNSKNILTKNVDYSILEIVHKTSIVNHEKNQEPSFINKIHPDWFDINTVFKKTTTYQPFGKEDIQGLKEFKHKEKLPFSELYSKIEKFIRKTIPIYKNINVLDVLKCANGAYYVIRVNSQYCMNIDREHNSNSIYFYIDKKSISQKCFCRCDTTVGRKFGKCAFYRSQLFPLETSLQKILFPYNDSNSNSDLCELNSMNFYYENRINYINNLQSFLDYLEQKIKNY